MRFWLSLARAAAVGWLSAGLIGTTHAEPLRIGYLTWVANGPFFVAQEKGFFAEEWIEVELIDMAIHEAMYAGLFAGRVDAIAATVDDMLPNFDPEQPYVCGRATQASIALGRGYVPMSAIGGDADALAKLGKITSCPPTDQAPTLQ